jgi:hypothetical protein
MGIYSKNPLWCAPVCPVCPVCRQAGDRQAIGRGPISWQKTVKKIAQDRALPPAGASVHSRAKKPSL